jgi:squalene-hopene/tetraprenyl-beta-curcumene cyclase
VVLSLAPSARDNAEATLDRGIDCLLKLQNPVGWWKGELQTNVTMDAEDLMMREFLGIRLDDETQRAARWVRSQQRNDGAWDVFHGGPADLSASVEAYTALRLAGDPSGAAHMKRAREHICDLGGIEGSRVFTRIWLALFGQWSWSDLPAMPPELILLPNFFPLNIYSFACWARQTIVPLTIVRTLEPVRPFSFDLRELRVGAKPARREPLSTWAGRFQFLDRLIHTYEKSPIKPFRKQALKIAAEWILRRQEADGCWGGIQPPWVYSIMALRLLGYPLNHPVVRKAINGLEDFTVRENGVRRFEACQSPIWDTCLAAVALRDAGLDPDHPALLRAGEWMIDEEVTVSGDWAVQRPDLPPGGWAFEFANDNYPDVDDTAEVIMALRGIESPDPEVAKRAEGACQRAIRWTLGMQSKNGGFAAFDADNESALVAALPFCDFGEVTDPPSADVTAHALEMLGREGLASGPQAQRAIEWLLAEQESDGSWFGRWGANHIYGTAAAVPALVECGVPLEAEPIRRAVRWTLSVQNRDGGWGEDLRSYNDANWRGRGTSTASQTAWALITLLAAEERGEAVERGAAWLADKQDSEGAWDEPEFTGTGFPGDFYINYHLYRQIFPVMALGRYLQRR